MMPNDTPSHELREAVSTYSNNTHLQRFSGTWSKKPLSELAIITMGQSPPSSFYNLRGEGVPLIQGMADFEGCGTTERQWTKKPTQLCKAGDLLLTVRAPVGSVAVATRGACLGRGVCGLKPFGDSAFLFFSMLHAEDRWQFLEQGSTFTAATSKQVRNFLLHVPDDQEEQHAIAEVLSDVDALLDALDRLIAKKRTVKQGTLQQLLTGRTRLPVFDGEWRRTTLGAVADIRNGATPNTHNAAYWNGAIPWCTPTDITGTSGKYLFTTKRYITPEGLASCAASLLPVGTLLLCSRATIGEVKVATTPVCTNQGFKSLVCREGALNEFLYYLLVTLKQQLIERAVGSTFLEVGKRDMASIVIRFPPLPEQHAIATVLSDIDAEIAALERRRDKIRDIKQGMMQQLLSGSVRLVEPE